MVPPEPPAADGAKTVETEGRVLEGAREILALELLSDDATGRARALAQIQHQHALSDAAHILLEMPADEAAWTKIRRALALIGMAAVPELCELLRLNKDSWPWGSRIAEALGDTGEPTSLWALVYVAADEQARLETRCSALDALSKSGAGHLTWTIIRILDGSNNELKIAAAWALAKIPNSCAISGLIAALDAGDARLRSAAAEALVAHGESVVEPLIAYVRGGRWLPPETKSRIVDILASPRTRAKEYLRAIARDDQAYSLAQDALHGSSSGCFVATAVYGSGDNNKMASLRRFRGEVLQRSRLGLVLIGLYCRLGPGFAQIVRHFAPLRIVCRWLLDRMVSAIDRRALPRPSQRRTSL